MEAIYTKNRSRRPPAQKDKSGGRFFA